MYTSFAYFHYIKVFKEKSEDLNFRFDILPNNTFTLVF